MLGSAAFQQFYNIVDSVIAGKFLGTRGLAAVGASYPITAIYTAVALGMNIGCTVVISQFFGGKKIEEMKTAISTAAVTFLSMAAVLL
ncbi:MAG: MATE family efflux transporter, partial [Lachnospiraceae bacterium]|nr:MATE family efflux transporter [Lachnospiraceae bacterium]